MGIFTFNNIFSDVAISGLTESVLPPLILNMSITASVIILFVLLARLALKKAPKIFSYALWAVVLFRLLCPVSITTDFSLLGLFDAPAVENTQHTTAVEYIPYDVVHTPDLEVQLPVPPAINDAVNNALPQEHAALGADPLEGEFAIGSLIWLLGIAAMAIYSAVSYILLRRKLVGSVLLRDNIYLADGIGSPFVMGFIRPKIYLPSALSEQEQSYIILHEQHHIRRGDHIIKALAFIALCIHWFNPLVWVAFILSSKDMEMSCDEAVVKKLGEGIRADYSASLLSLATGRRIIAGTPLAFGEGDTKSRIKNMLSWKQAKPPVIFLATAAVILIVLICGTNASKDANSSGNSWVDIKYNAREVELTCNLEEPIRSYAIYEDIYENGVLISSSPRIMDRFLEDGGATPRQFTFSLTVQSMYAEIGEGFAGELNCTWAGVGDINWKTVLPKARYTGSGQVFPESEGKQKLDTEDSVILLMALLSTREDESLTMQSKDQTLMECNDTVVVYRLVTSSEGPEKYTAEENFSTVNNVYGTADDISYYLELAAGERFQDMSLEKRAGFLVEYEDLLDDYTLIARETADGNVAYIVGQYNGNPLESPLHGMYSIDMYTGEEDYFRFLYREEAVETVEAVVAANKTEFPPSAGYRIEDSLISWADNSGVILIQPKDNSLLLDVPWNRYFYTPNGREYIVDAVSRGIDVCGRTDTFLYVYRFDQRFGEIAERIALTEAEAQAILTEERVTLPEGFGFSATLHMNGETKYFYVDGENKYYDPPREGIPQSVLDLAVEKCGYTFASPSDIKGSILSARLDCDWLDAPLYAENTDLPRLKEILTNSEFALVRGHDYGARLTLSLSGGETLTLFKDSDGFDTIVFGSYGGYFLGEQENIEFWEMFGLDPDTKEHVETKPADAKDEVLQLFNESTWRGATFFSRNLAPGNVVFGSPDTVTKIGRVISSAQWEYVEAPASEPTWENLIEMYPFVFYDRDGLVRYGGPSNDSTPWDEPSMEDAVWYQAPGVFEALQEATETSFVGESDNPAEPTAPPTETDIHNAIMANNKWTDSEAALYPYRTEAHYIWGTKWNGTRCAVYALGYRTTFEWGNGQQKRIYPEQVGSMELVFEWDGKWNLTSFWMPAEDEDFIVSIQNRFPADIAAIVLGEVDSDILAALNAQCHDAALQYYATLTDLPPAKTFTPADVNFSGKLLTSTPDEMTYEERLAWVQAGPDYQQTHFTSLGQYAEGDGCIAYLGQWVGTPHMNQYRFDIRFADGTTAHLPLPDDGGWGSVPPDTMTFQNDRFIYEMTFPTQEVTNEGETLIHLKGTYHYEVDLATKTVSLSVLQ